MWLTSDLQGLIILRRNSWPITFSNNLLTCVLMFLKKKISDTVFRFGHQSEEGERKMKINFTKYTQTECALNEVYCLVMTSTFWWSLSLSHTHTHLTADEWMMAKAGRCRQSCHSAALLVLAHSHTVHYTQCTHTTHTTHTALTLHTLHTHITCTLHTYCTITPTVTKFHQVWIVSI